MSKYKICYYGSSNDFFENLKVFISKQKDLDLELAKVSAFPSHNRESVRTTIILDASLLKEDDQLLTKILKIRKSRFSGKYIFVILENSFVNDSSQLVYFRCGVNYIIVKDGDITSSLDQMFYLLVEEDYAHPKFATTKKFFAKSEISIPLYLTEINEESLSICSDVPLEGEFDIEYGDSLRSQVKIEQSSDRCPDAFSMYRASATFCEPDVWDESRYSSWDTIETQLDCYENTSKYIKHKVLLIDTSETYKKNEGTIANYMKEIDVDVVSSRTLDLETLSERGDRIIIIGKLSKEIDRVDYLFDVIQHIQNQNFDIEPLVIFPNSPSAPDALKKAVRYKKLLGFKSPLEKPILANFLGTLAAQGPMLTEVYYLGLKEKHSLSFKNYDIHITAISEFFVTFTTQTEIPLYSLVRLDIGISLNLIIVPPTKFLSKIGGKQHYMAFVFLLSEADLQLLRKSVNHFMFTEVNEIDDDFKSYFDQDLKEELDAKKLNEELEKLNAQEEDCEKEEEFEDEEDDEDDFDEETSKIKYKKGYISKL